MDSSSDFEGITLDSTEVSEQDSDKEYEVEKILAQKLVDGLDRFLVKWKGYPISRSTWEPQTSFNDPGTIKEWKRTAARQREKLEEQFDWEEWDQKRDEELRSAYERRRKRATLRKRQGWTRPYREGKLKGFVVDDGDATESEAESEASSGDPRERRRKRKKGSGSSGSDDGASSDSLMREYRMKRLKQKKFKHRRTADASEEDSPPPSPRTKVERRKDLVRPEKRKRPNSPSATLSGATRKLSLGVNKDAQEKSSERQAPRKRQKLQQAVKMVVKAPRPGPSRIQKFNMPPESNRPGSIKTFNSLSYVNRVMKAGKNEPPPDISKIELFSPGHPSRVMPPLLPIVRRASNTSQGGASPERSFSSIAQNIARPSSPERPNRAIPNFRIPKRKPNLPPVSIQPSLAPMHEEAAFDSDIPDRDGTWNVSSHSLDRPQLSTPRDAMDVDHVGPRAFSCNLEIGPKATSVGEARFNGFPSSFVDELYSKHNCQTLWISKFYGQDYLRDFFAPSYGSPNHIAAIETDADAVQPLVNTLTYLKGAGVVLHEDFTMLIFHISNSDIKTAFKLPQLQTVPNRGRPSFRAVVYPRLEGINIPSVKDIQSPGAAERAADPPWGEDDLRLSLSSYLASIANFDWDDVLDTARGKKDAGKEKREALYVLTYPPIATAESEEYKEALESMGKKVIDVKDLRNMKNATMTNRLTFLIHQSLRRQLHLLPEILRYRKGTGHAYWFYGTKIEERRIEDKPQRIWSMGTLIFITPQLIISSPQAMRECMNYQTNKAGTTKLGLPSIWEEKVWEAVQKEPNGEFKGEVLNLIYDIKRKSEQNSVILIPLELHPGVNEFDIYIDEFALYQLDNPFEFRRYCLGHSSMPDSIIMGLYSDIEFYTPDTLLTEFTSSSKKAQPAQPTSRRQSDVHAPSGRGESNVQAPSDRH